MKENQTDYGVTGEIIDKIFERGTLFKIAVIIFMIWMTWSIYKIQTQKYTYNIEFAKDVVVADLLNKYGDMGCIEIIDCRAFGEVDFVKYITSKPIMRGYQLQYKNRTFLNW